MEGDAILTAEDKETGFNYLYSSVLSSIVHCKSALDTGLVINIAGFVDLVTQSIATIKEQKKSAAINFHRDRYSNGIKKKIDESAEFIEKINSSIEDLHEKISTDISKILEEISDLIRKGKEKEQEFKNRQDELNKWIPYKMMLGGFNIFAKSLAFLGPKGAILGELMSGGIGLAKDNCKSGDDPVPLKIPGGAYKALGNAKQAQIDKAYEDQKKRNLENQKKLSQLKLENLEKQKAYFEEKGAPENRNKNIKIVDKLINEERENIKNQKKQQQAADAINKGLEKAEAALGVAQASMELYNEFKGDENKIKALDEAIKANKAQIEKLGVWQNNVQSFFNDKIGGMKKQTDLLQQNIKGQSQISLDFSKFEIKKDLCQMQHDAKKMTEGLDVKGDLSCTIQQMEEALKATIGIYDRLQDFEEQIQLSQYIANIGSSAGNVSLKDKVLQSKIDRLDQITTQKIFLADYERALNAVIRTSFPFAKYHLEEFETLTPDVKTTLDAATDAAIKNLRKLDKELKEYSLVLKNPDFAAYTTSFSSCFKSSKPFFTWSGADYPRALQSLFQGKETPFKADITQQHLSVVKFTTLNLKIKHEDTEINDALTKQLEKFHVILSSYGDSDYKFGEKKYQIFNGNIKIEHSVEKEENGKFVTHTIAGKKIEEGDKVLSPYGLWGIQLNPSPFQNLKEKTVLLNNLSEFFKELPSSQMSGFSLELEGKGYYIDENKIIEDLELDKYYPSVNSTKVNESINFFFIE